MFDNLTYANISAIVTDMLGDFAVPIGTLLGILLEFLVAGGVVRLMFGAAIAPYGREWGGSAGAPGQSSSGEVRASKKRSKSPEADYTYNDWESLGAHAARYNDWNPDDA